MQINEVTTLKLTKKVLKELLGKNMHFDKNFDINGISKDYLFLINGDSMAVYDISAKKYIIPYMKGLLKSFVKKSTGEMIIAHATSSDITKICNNSNGELLCNHHCKTIIPDMEYSRFALDGSKIPFKKCYIDEEKFCDTNVRYHYYDKESNKDSYEDEVDLKKDTSFDQIKCDNFINRVNISKHNYNFKHTSLKKCDKWDAQSQYNEGLSIIYKNIDGKELYGVADTDYNVVFDYDESVKTIKILYSDLLLVGNNEDLNSVFDLKRNCYVCPFKYEFNTVERLSTDIFRVKINDKYRLIKNGSISDEVYDDIGFDREILILTINDEIRFIDSDNNILYKLKKQKFLKSKKDIYYEFDSNIIKHNLLTGKEDIIGKRTFYDGDKKIETSSVDEILNNYNFYYIDNEGIVRLFKTMKYGIELKSNNVSIYRWYDSKKYVYEFQKSLLESLLFFDKEKENSKKLIKK